MTTMKEENSEDEEWNEEPRDEIANPGLDDMASRSSSKSSTNERKAAELTRHLYTVCDSTGNVLCYPGEYDQHQLIITYEKLTESSYSEVVSRYQCLTRAQCFEISTLMDPEVVERAADYDPLDEGFTISNIEKGEKCFLQEIFLSLDGDESSVPSYHYPSASDTENKLTLHQPTEVWGFDGEQLILAVVTSQYLAPQCFLHVDQRWARNNVWQRILLYSCRC
jgi:hypothetical protein